MHSLRLKSINLRDLEGSILYKSEGGFKKNAALLALSDGAILFKIPRVIGTIEFGVRVFCDGEYEGRLFTGKWVGLEHDFDIYEVLLNLSSGLYFYTPEITTSSGLVYGIKDGAKLRFSYENE